MAPRRYWRDWPPRRRSCSRGFYASLPQGVARKHQTPPFLKTVIVRRGRSGSPAPLWLTLSVSAREGHDREGRHGGGGGLRVWGGARGRAAGSPPHENGAVFLSPAGAPSARPAPPAAAPHAPPS